MNSNFAGFSSTGGMSNVERIELTNTSSIARSFDASGVAGVDAYAVYANKAATVNLADFATGTGANLELHNQTSGTFSTTFVTGAAELTGASDAATLTINNVGTLDDASTSADETSAVTATLNDFETVNVAALTDSVIAFGGTDLKTLNISGEGNVEVTAVATSLTSFDASASTGNIEANVTATTSTLTTVATGSGDDKVTFDAVDANANAALSGGAGEDTLTLNSNGGTVQYNMSGFETLALNAINAALVFSAANTTDLTAVSSVAATAQTVTIVGGGTGDLTVTSKGETVDAGDISADNSGAVALNYEALAASVTAKTAENAEADYTFANASGLTVNVGEYVDTTGSDISAAKATSLTLNVASGKSSATTPVEVTEFDGAITAAKATSVVVNAEGKLGSNATITAAAAKSVEISNGATAGDLDVVAAVAETLTVTSGNTLDLSAGSNFSGVQSATLNVDQNTLTVGALADIANLTATGAGTATGKLSAVVVGNLGGANDYDMTVTASGLKGGFTAGTLDVNTGYDITADVTGVTGNATLGNIGASTAGDAVSINATGLGGNLSVGTITATGDITVTGSATGTTRLGDISAGATGNVVVALDGSTGAVTTGSFTGKTVNIDMSDTIGGKVGTTYTVSAKDAATVATSELEGSTVSITAGTGSTALTAAVTGGLGNDGLTVTGLASNTSITVTGDLDLGTNSLTVDTTTNANTAAITINATGISDYTAGTFNLGGTAASTVNLGSGTEADTIVWSDSVKATVTGFDTTEDKLNLDAVSAQITGTNSALTVAAAGTVTDGDTYVIADGATTITTSGSESIVDYDSLVDVAAYLNERFDVSASGDEALFVINDLGSGCIDFRHGA